MEGGDAESPGATLIFQSLSKGSGNGGDDRTRQSVSSQLCGAETFIVLIKPRFVACIPGATS